MKALYTIYNAVLDLIILSLPFSRKKQGFAFIVHPRDMDDVIGKFPFLKFFPKSFQKGFVLSLWPVTASKITGVTTFENGEKVPGWMIASPITPELLVSDRERAIKSFVKAVKLAEKKGARYVGLGALSSSLTHGGKLLEKYTDTIIITGRLFTAHNVTELATKAAKEVGIKNETAVVAIVGAAGSIGSASAQILAKHGYTNFTLIDLTEKTQRMEAISKEMQKLNPSVAIRTTNDIEQVRDADLIIVATNRTDSFITSELLKPGAVVVDDAKPVNVRPEVIDTRDDVLVLEGGAVETENVCVHMNIGLQNKTDVYSCLAEVVILAADKHHEHFNLGEMLSVDFESINHLTELGKKMGIKTGTFQNYKKSYTQSDLKKVHQARQ